MGLTAYTDEERLIVARWRGLDAGVLNALSRLDAEAIERGTCRFVVSRAEDIESRRRCLEIRERLGLGVMEKLKKGLDLSAGGA